MCYVCMLAAFTFTQNATAVTLSELQNLLGKQKVCCLNDVFFFEMF